MSTEIEALKVKSGDAPRPKASRRWPLLAWASLLMPPLAFAIFFAVGEIGERFDALPFTTRGYAQTTLVVIPEPPLQRVLTAALHVPAFLPIAGFVLARRSRSEAGRRTLIATLGLAVNAILLPISGVVLALSFGFHHVMPKIDGRFLINGDLAEDPVIFMEAPDRPVDYKTTKRDGSFAFYGLKPGVYELRAKGYLSPRLSCKSSWPLSNFEIINPSDVGYSVEVYAVDDHVVIPPIPFWTAHIDFRLRCR